MALCTPHRRALPAAVALLVAVASASAYVAAQRNSPSSGPIRTSVSDEQSVSDINFAAAQPRADRPNRLREGDASAVAAFETVQPAGALTALPANGDPVKGTFSPVFDWPLIGIHSVLTPDGRVLSYGTNGKGNKTGYFIYDVWDPQLGIGPESHKTLANQSGVDIFCNTQLLLPSGKIEMWGGDITYVQGGYSLLRANDDSNLYDPINDSLVRTGKMNRIRWYASSTTLPNGDVYIQGGADGESSQGGGKDFPEVRTATGQFRLLSNASTLNINALYPRNWVAPDGKIFGLHYSRMYRVDPSGLGTITQVGKFARSNIGGTSTSVMFRPGKILQLGGGLDASYASPDAHVLDIHPNVPTITEVARPNFRRHWGNATVLPDGKVFLTGGSTADNSAVNGVAYTSEIYDPDRNTWTLAATSKRMRLYHASSLLLPDGTVLTMGGGSNGPELNLNAEIYYPPYLFNADGSPAARPVISSVPMTLDPTRSFRIATPNAGDIRRVTLVKAGSNTHSVDMDQRFIELPFTSDGTGLQAQLPSNPYATPPGFYLVFVINSQGVPSEAMPMRINIVGGSAEPPPPAPTNLVVNGDFEVNSVPDGSGALVTDLQGWRNRAGPIEVWRNNFGYTPGRNTSYIEVDGAAGTTKNRVYQNVPTTKGATYKLSFLHSPRPGNSATSNRFDVYWNGTRIFRAGVSGSGLTNTQWQRVTLTVTATHALASGSDRISFFELDSDTDDRGALIDDVQLTRE